MCLHTCKGESLLNGALHLVEHAGALVDNVVVVDLGAEVALLHEALQVHVGLVDAVWAEGLLGLLGGHHELQPRLAVGPGVQVAVLRLELVGELAGKRGVHVAAANAGVTGSGQHIQVVLCEGHNGDVEGTGGGCSRPVLWGEFGCLACD